jgi:hypothetical protein
VVERLHSPVLNEGSRISDDSTGSTADMRINLEDLLNGLRDDEGRVESALNSEDDSLEALDADG